MDAGKYRTFRCVNLCSAQSYDSALHEMKTVDFSPGTIY